MSKTRKPRKGLSRRREEGWPLVVYLWIMGLGLLSYIVVGEMALRARPHPIHWAAALLCGVAGAGGGGVGGGGGGSRSSCLVVGWAPPAGARRAGPARCRGCRP